MGFQPFGKAWRKEVSKLSVNQLESMFDMKSNEKEEKSGFIARIAKAKNPNR